MVKQDSVNRRFSKIIAGFVALSVILSSSSLYQAQDNIQKEKKEQTEKSSGSDFTISAAPSDAVPAGSSLQLASKTFLILENFLPALEEPEPIVTDAVFRSGYIRTLFSVIISPNAP